MIAFHNVIGAAVHVTHKYLGLEPISSATTQPQKKRKTNVKKELLSDIFSCLIAAGTKQQCKFAEHTKLSEKYRGALTYLNRDAFNSFFVLLIRILSRELLVDKKIACDRRELLMVLLCNRALRLSFAQLLKKKGAISTQV